MNARSFGSACLDLKITLVSGGAKVGVRLVPDLRGLQSGLTAIHDEHMGHQLFRYRSSAAGWIPKTVFPTLTALWSIGMDFTQRNPVQPISEPKLKFQISNLTIA